jgi:hypothetical protein
MGSSPSVHDIDESLQQEEIIAKVYGTFSYVNYRMIKSAILPIITDKPKNENKKIYEDNRLPPAFRQKINEFETFVEREMNLVTFIGIWMLCKLPINLWKNGNIFTGVSLFDRHVLTLAIPTFAFGFGFLKENLFGRLDFFSIEEILFEDKKNNYISMYRKRLVERHPDYASLLYTKDLKWLASDGVDPSLFKPVVLAEEEKKDGLKAEETQIDDETLTETELEYLKTLALNNSNKS